MVVTNGNSLCRDIGVDVWATFFTTHTSLL